MGRTGRDKSRQTLREFFAGLSTGQWWKIIGFLVALLTTGFKAGAYWESRFGDTATERSAHESRFTLLIESQKSYPVLNGRLLAALEPGATGEDRLDLRTTAGWSDSPSGPFLRDEGHNGPRYHPGFRAYFKLLDGEVWSVSVLAVHEQSVETEFMKWTE